MKGDKMPALAWAITQDGRLVIVDSRVPVFWRRPPAHQFAQDRGFTDYKVVRVSVSDAS